MTLLHGPIFLNLQTHEIERALSSHFPPPSDWMEFREISEETAHRIANKRCIVAAIKEFIADKNVELATECIELGARCYCKKNGRFYGFDTDFLSFVPREISECDYLKYTSIDGRMNRYQFLALTLYVIYHRTFESELLKLRSEDLLDFKLYSDGTAYDGSGVAYAGELWPDGKIRLAPQLYLDTYVNDGKYATAFHPATSDVSTVGAEEFYNVCKTIENPSSALWQQRYIASCASRHERDDTRDLVESGLMDIYGEPGGWQFNNED